VPVLIAPPSDQGPRALDSSTMEFGQVLVPVDFKDESERDLRAAADIAQTLSVPLLLVHVVAPVKGLERLRLHLDIHNRAQLERAGKRSSGSFPKSEGQWISKLLSRSDRLRRRLPRSQSRETSGSLLWAFDVKSTCSEHGQGRSRIACWA
jgi:hypothetical protein